MDANILTLEAKAVAAERASDNTALYHLQMSVEEWAAVSDNPRQRDTERRLQRAKHLLVKSPEHAVVHMAASPRDERWKLDGHTRAMLWTEQPELAPGSLLVGDGWERGAGSGGGSAGVTVEAAWSLDLRRDSGVDAGTSGA